MECRRPAEDEAHSFIQDVEVEEHQAPSLPCLRVKAAVVDTQGLQHSTRGGGQHPAKRRGRELFDMAGKNRQSLDVGFARLQQESGVVESEPEVAAEFSFDCLVRGVIRRNVAKDCTVVHDKPCPFTYLIRTTTSKQV